MSKTLEKIVLDQAASYAAKLATNEIIFFLQRWRFYFDNFDRSKMNDEIKKLLIKVVENVANRKF